MLRTALIAAAAAPLALAQTWSIIAANVGTVATGISINEDGKTGFLPADDNGSGTTVLLTTDGGQTWSRHAKAQFDLILLDVASYANYVEVTGVLTDQFSWDTGATFNDSINGAAGAQCVRTIGNDSAPSGFGFPVDGGQGAEGVAVSTDGGLSFTHYYAPQVNEGARYAAFPSSKNWYMVAGTWPGESPLEQAEALGLDLAAGDQLVRLTQKISIAKWKKTGVSKFVSRRPSQIGKPAKGEYLMQIVATTNGGSSWTLQYNETHGYYGNGIECTTTINCCVVAEADTGAEAGSYIFCTANGGQTWANTYNNTDPNSSLVDIAAVGPNELWAVGGEFNSIGPASATFLHSLDGGQTWTKATANIPNQYAIAVDCVPAVNNCWAVTIDLDQQASVASITSQ